tara:strand:- start:2303 stop:2716 length:414 start_codon:yes stop_codon:yes gene_type:complete
MSDTLNDITGMNSNTARLPEGFSSSIDDLDPEAVKKKKDREARKAEWEKEREKTKRVNAAKQLGFDKMDRQNAARKAQRNRAQQPGQAQPIPTREQVAKMTPEQREQLIVRRRAALRARGFTVAQRAHSMSGGRRAQ